MQATTSNFKTVIAGNDITVDAKVTISLPIVRRNLCPNPNSKYSIAYGWATSDGSGIAQVTAIGGVDTFFNSGGTNQTLTIGIATRPGSTYGVLGAITGGTGSGITGVRLIALGGLGNSPTMASDNVLRDTSFTFVATGYLTMVGVQALGTYTGLAFTVCQFLDVEEGGVPPNKFNGDTAGASWDGPAGQSTSTLNADPYPDVTLAVESITVDRQTVTDMPSGTRLQTGYPSASATLVLSGLLDQTDASKDAAWLFSPYSTTSPLYRLDPTGSPVTIAAGLASSVGALPELLTMFTGGIDTYDIDPVAGTVTIQCADNRGALRTIPTLSGVAASLLVQVPTGGSLGTCTPGLTGGWVVDTVLRANGYYASTAPRVGCGFYASMCGSAYPQIYNRAGYPVLASFSGTYADESNISPMQFVPGNWAGGVCRDGKHYAPLATPVQLTAGWHVEWGMNCTPPDAGQFPGGVYPAMQVSAVDTDGVGNAVQTVTFTLTYVSGTTWAFTADDATVHNVTLSAAWHVFDVQVVGNVFTLWADGGTALGTWTSSTTVTSGIADVITTVLPYTVEAFQVTNETNGLPRTLAAPNATIDASLNMLAATVDPGTADAWQLIQQLAEAEGAVAGLDELGLFRFTNRLSLTSGTPVRTVSSSASLKTLGIETSLANVANHIVLPVNPISVSFFGTVWNLSTKVQIAGYGTYSTVASTQYPVVGPATICGVIPLAGVTPTTPRSGYRAALAADGTGGPITNLAMTVEQIGPSSIAIAVHNPNSYAVWLVTPANVGYPVASVGQPALTVAGQVAWAVSTSVDQTGTTTAVVNADSQWPPASEGGAVTNRRGEIALTLNANPWVQDLPSAQAFTDDLLADLYKPRPMWTNVALVADPSLQLTDRVTVADPDASLILADDAIIFSLRTTITANDFSQAGDFRAVAPAGGWVLGVVGKSELAVATYA